MNAWISPEVRQGFCGAAKLCRASYRKDIRLKNQENVVEREKKESANTTNSIIKRRLSTSEKGSELGIFLFGFKREIKR